MIVQKSLEKLIAFDRLTEEEKADPELAFQHYGRDAIIEKAGAGYYTYKLFKSGADYTDIHVDYGPDMFYLSYESVIQSDYAIADDPDGNHICILEYATDIYSHGYVYNGGGRHVVPGSVWLRYPA